MLYSVLFPSIPVCFPAAVRRFSLEWGNANYFEGEHHEAHVSSSPVAGLLICWVFFKTRLALMKHCGARERHSLKCDCWGLFGSRCGFVGLKLSELGF